MFSPLTLAKQLLPSWSARSSWSARLAKRIVVYARYHRQANKCRAGYQRVGRLYRQPLLFVAGLPKSGTTWLQKMLGSYEGFHELLIPDVTAYELKTGGSHNYQLPTDIFDRLQDMLVITKMHVHGSRHNAELLSKHQIPYVVLFRDLRDVAVSYYYYVHQTPWHPEYPRYHSVNVEEGLIIFAENLLSAYRDWVVSWQENHDPLLSLFIRYEEMLDDTEVALGRIARHFQLPDTPDLLKQIIERNGLRNLRRSAANYTGAGFFRAGISGDWQNHFTPRVRAMFKEIIGEFLLENGYETSANW